MLHCIMRLRLFQESWARKRHVADVYRTKSDRFFQECLLRQRAAQDKVERISDCDISGDGTMPSFFLERPPPDNRDVLFCPIKVRGMPFTHLQ